MTKFKFSLFLTTLLTTELVLASPFQSSNRYQPDSITQECSEFINKIQSQFEYGWIPSKESFDEKRSQVMPVFYYYKKGSALKNPVLFFNGGPANSSHISFPYIEAANQKHVGSYLDFIYMDQRGTGCSQGYYPIGVDYSVLKKLRWYGSEGIVRDAEILRTKLLGANSKWKVFGQSYGAMIVYRYLELFPQSIISAYAHANAMDIGIYGRAYHRILGQYLVFQRYAKANPKDSQRLLTLTKYLSDPEKCFNQQGLKTCGYEVLFPLVTRLGFRDQWSYVNNEVKYLVPVNQVREVALQEFVQRPGNAFHHYAELDQQKAMQQASSFANFSSLFDWETLSFDAKICSQVIQDIAIKNKYKPENIVMHECMAPLQHNYEDQVIVALRLNQKDIPSMYTKSETVLRNISQFKIPLYVYSGALDSLVYPTNFLRQNSILGSKAKYKNFPNSGHDGYYTEKQIYQDLLR